MDTNKFFEKLLKVKDPWFVDRVEMNEAGNRVDVYVNHHNPISVACPECGEFFAPYDHSPERVFQHLNTCEYQTFVHIRLPRVKCDKHGVKQIHSELGGKNSHLTFSMEKHLLAMAGECSISAITRLTGLSWDRILHCIEKAVTRGLKRKPKKIPERIAVDEKSFAKGHKYETLVCDHEEGTVEYVTDKNTEKSLESYYEQFTEEEKESVKVITMDMWVPYISATQCHIPESEKKIVFDRYHVMTYMTKAVDTVRKMEHALLKEEGNECLKGTKYLWLWNYENIPEWRKNEFHELQNTDLNVSRAWAIKENLRHLWDYHSEGWARRFFKKWYFWATHSRLKPVIKAAQTIKDHFENIVTYVHHHITNALVEGLNSKIEKVKRMAYGFRNREHYKMMIYFHCGGLDLSPSQPASNQIQWAVR